MTDPIAIPYVLRSKAGIKKEKGYFMPCTRSNCPLLLKYTGTHIIIGARVIEASASHFLGSDMQRKFWGSSKHVRIKCTRAALKKFWTLFKSDIHLEIKKTNIFRSISSHLGGSGASYCAHFGLSHFSKKSDVVCCWIKKKTEYWLTQLSKTVKTCILDNPSQEQKKKQMENEKIRKIFELQKNGRMCQRANFMLVLYADRRKLKLCCIFLFCIVSTTSFREKQKDVLDESFEAA